MHAAAIITVAALVTIIIRALPFLVFQKSTPEPVLYLGRVLPYAVMGMLVVSVFIFDLPPCKCSLYVKKLIHQSCISSYLFY